MKHPLVQILNGRPVNPQTAPGRHQRLPTPAINPAVHVRFVTVTTLLPPKVALPLKLSTPTVAEPSKLQVPPLKVTEATVTLSVALTVDLMPISA